MLLSAVWFILSVRFVTLKSPIFSPDMYLRLGLSLLQELSYNSGAPVGESNVSLVFSLRPSTCDHVTPLCNETIQSIAFVTLKNSKEEGRTTFQSGNDEISPI